MQDSLVLYLENIIKPLVDHPEEVDIVETHDSIGTLLTVRVSPLDVGRIIGIDGKTAAALRIILRTLGHARNREKIYMKVINPREDKSFSSDEGGFRYELKDKEEIIS